MAMRDVQPKFEQQCLAGSGVGPGRFEFEKAGSRDGGGDVDEEWNVIVRKVGSRGKGSVGKSICPCKVKEDTI